MPNEQNPNVNLNGESEKRDTCLNKRHNAQLGFMDILVRVSPKSWFTKWKEERNEAKSIYREGN